VQPRRYEGKSEAEKQLSTLLVRRKQLEEMLKAEQNRLRTISPSLAGSVERIIAILKEEKKRSEEQIRELMNEQKAWQEQTELLSSAPGVGIVTTATLDQGRQDRCPQCALYVYPCGHALQPANPSPIPALAETRQPQEGGSHGLYAQIPHDLECDDARPATVPHVIVHLSNGIKTATALTAKIVAGRGVGRFLPSDGEPSNTTSSINLSR